MNGFKLAAQLEKDSLFVRDLPLSQLRLSNRKAIPWLILVPRRNAIREIYELTDGDRHQLMDEITRASKALMQLYAPDKMNIGALGNVVPQLHIHVVARFTSDEAWPAPVWGRIAEDLYEPGAAGLIISKLKALDLWD